LIEVRIEENRELASLTTLGVGGPARWFVEAESELDVAEAAGWVRAAHVPLFVLGGGSNLLVADGGFAGLVLRVALKGVKVKESAGGMGGRIYAVAAGEDWDEFVERTVKENCAGLECLAGIPGTVGGTPVQNVGAYGQEVASTIVRVRGFDLQRNAFVDLNADECGFGYRRSRFNSGDKGRYILTGVEYRLTVGGSPSLRYADLQRIFPSGTKPSLREVAEAVRGIRRAKGMLIVEGESDCRSAGSFFKNPVVAEGEVARIAQMAGADPPCYPAGADNPGCVKLAAAWLIERAGFSKGYALGKAAISTKHTLALVNLGGATAEEIVALANQIRGRVAERFSIDLLMEPVMIGFQDRF
jgi:UDP-N-acetylmuramate dehydrogenase